MTKKTKEKDVTEIGSFKRPKEEEKGEMPPVVDPNEGIGSQSIRDFMAGKARSMMSTAAAEPKDTSTPPAKDVDKRHDELVKAIEEIENAPELTYDEKLERHGLSKEQAMEILDAMFTKGFFEKTYKVVASVNVTFRTRKAEDQDRLLQRLEAEAPQFPATVSNLVSKYNLAASLWEYKDKSFAKAEFKQKYDYVSNLPDTIFRLLCVKLAKFDQMMLDVLDEGAIANF